MNKCLYFGKWLIITLHYGVLLGLTVDDFWTTNFYFGPFIFSIYATPRGCAK